MEGRGRENQDGNRRETLANASTLMASRRTQNNVAIHRKALYLIITGNRSAI